MNNALYIIASILLIVWAVGHFLLYAHNNINILLGLAIALLLLRGLISISPVNHHHHQDAK